ncbi:MAG: hypothetical protein ABIG34_01565 [Candidatus Peregrinibacteria bacterium]
MAARSPRKKKASQQAKPKKKRLITKSAFLLTLVYIVIIPALIALRLSVFPQIGEITYRFDGKETGTGSNPLFVKSEGKNLYMRLSISLPAGQPTMYKIKPDDCIETLTINGKEVTSDIAKYCDYTTYGRPLDLSSYLKTGENTFLFRLKDTGGKAGLRITPQYTTLPFILLNYGALILTILYALALMWPIVKRSSARSLWAIGIGGALLRIFYFIVTPYTLRGHDMQAHLNYVTYVAEHWSIPPASDGWEFHQAPLYYFFSACWMKAGQWLHSSTETIARMVQFQSLFFSIGALAVGIWIGTLLLPRKEKTGRLLFACLVAFFPSLIYHSGSINNNGLYILFAFLTTALLVQWWQKPTARIWYLMICCLALAFVTRVSALVFVPVMGISLLFHDKIRLGKKMQQAVFSVILFVLLVSWMPLIRLTENNPTNSLTFNSQSMNSKLSVSTDAWTFLTFNPVRVLRSPYANPWKDTSPREYFWEYFFRSAFFGEFSYSDELRAVAALILACALSLIPFLAFGLVKLTLHYSHRVFPLGLIIIFVLAAHFFYRIYAPFSSNQDFRFSIAIVPPMAFYLVWGICEGPRPLRSVGTYLAIAFSSLSAIFVVFLGFFSS